MSSVPLTLANSKRDRHRARRPDLIIAAILAIVAVLSLALRFLVQIPPAWSGSRSVTATFEVDRGDIAHIVTENGSVESSEHDVVRCQVESFLTLPSAARARSGDLGPTQQATRSAAGAAGSKASSALNGGGKGPVVAGASRAKSPGSASQGAGDGATSAPQFDAATATSGPSTVNEPTNQEPIPESAKAPKRPVIRSFDQKVAPYVPLRAALSDQGAIAIKPPAPPTILSILPQGTEVHAGEIVCELDSSAFREARDVQQLRYLRAKAWVEQAGFILEASEIALREYQDGILPQDILLIRHYTAICEAERDRMAHNLAWARAAFAKGFRTEGQVESESARVELAEIKLDDAREMLRRLLKFTSKRVLKAHKAKIAAIRADRLSLETLVQLERERLDRIESMIAHCTMRAPRAGIVVYANRVNTWGTVEMQIREGLRVYQSQPIFRLLDSARMHIQARINETQISRVRAGQPVLIHLDAFPERVLKGCVAEIKPLPTFASGMFSDVHSYVANVRIESGGFGELRSGLSAKLDFLVETRRRVPRVPLEAIRWFGDQSFAAMVVSTATGLQWLWRPIEVGVSDTAFAEVVSGLEPGNRVVAHAENLPPEGSDLPDPDILMDLAVEEP
jgi:HlyD family secretion protein